MSDLKLFSGNATPELANEIAKCLYTNLANATVDTFSDGEVHVQINECVRGCDTFVIQSTPLIKWMYENASGTAQKGIYLKRWKK